MKIIILASVFALTTLAQVGWEQCGRTTAGLSPIAYNDLYAAGSTPAQLAYNGSQGVLQPFDAIATSARCTAGGQRFALVVHDDEATRSRIRETQLYSVHSRGSGFEGSLWSDRSGYVKLLATREAHAEKFRFGTAGLPPEVWAEYRSGNTHILHLADRYSIERKAVHDGGLICAAWFTLYSLDYRAGRGEAKTYKVGELVLLGTRRAPTAGAYRGAGPPHDYTVRGFHQNPTTGPSYWNANVSYEFAANGGCY